MPISKLSPQNNAKEIEIFAKVAKFRQTWSQWYQLTLRKGANSAAQLTSKENSKRHLKGP